MSCVTITGENIPGKQKSTIQGQPAVETVRRRPGGGDGGSKRKVAEGGGRGAGMGLGKGGAEWVWGPCHRESPVMRGAGGQGRDDSSSDQAGPAEQKQLVQIPYRLAGLVTDWVWGEREIGRKHGCPHSFSQNEQKDGASIQRAEGSTRLMRETRSSLALTCYV